MDLRRISIAEVEVGSNSPFSFQSIQAAKFVNSLHAVILHEVEDAVEDVLVHPERNLRALG